MLREAEVFLLSSLDLLALLLGDNFQALAKPKRPSDKKGCRSAHEAGAQEETATQQYPKVDLHTRGASLTMVRASTQQTVDRIVGTAAVIGLSVVFLRWLANTASSEKKQERIKKYSGVPWWWPALAIKGWKKRNNRKSTDNKRTEDEGQVVENNENDAGEYEHQGSCHCGSINFVLRGPRRLQAVDSPGKIRYPHFPTSANNFQLVSGENNMRFYYEDDDKNDDSSSITFDHAGEERNDAKQASGAHVFCANCGVHVFHADRTTGELQVNANCLDAEDNAKLVYREQSSSGLSSITNTINQQQEKASPLRSQSSLSSTQNQEVDNANNDDVEQLARNSTIETVSENEPFLGSASRFLESLDDSRSVHSSLPRKESISSDPTQPESYSTTMIAEGDDSSMGSSSITGASMPMMYQSSLSVASGGVASTHDRAGLPPLGPSRLSSTDRSVKTLPAFLGERPGYRTGGARGGAGSSWSVASMESTDLDGVDTGKSTVSPRMRDQMKKYMGRHMHSSEKG